MQNKNNIYIWDNSAVTNSLIKKISESNHFDKIYYGNKRAIYLYDKAIKLNEDGKELFKTLKKQNIKYVLANSEATDKKFIDIAEKFGFKIIGAFQKSTQLESSKIFAKKLMDKYNIKTAKYIVVKNKNEVIEAFKILNKPLFIKADGYAKSLSSEQVTTEKQYKKVTQEFLNGKWSYSSNEFIIEEKVYGKEVSIPLILDGENIRIFNYILDYKRKTKTGKNTGGMGSLCPYDLSNDEIKKVQKLLEKLKLLLKQENLFYKGFMTINVIINKSDIFLLEINTRLGDSEGQVILEILETDMFDIIEGIENKTINKLDIKFKKNYAMAVNIINKNYPNLQKKEQAKINKNSIKELLSKDIQVFFYNNIKEDENFYIQNCDRFLSIVSSENNINSLQKKLYDKISKIEGENIFFRKDIGKLN